MPHYKNDGTSSLSHTKWNCQYHIVFTPKYRRKAIYAKLRTDIGKYIRRLCEYKGVEIVEAHAMPDHIHMLVKVPPKLSISSFMGYDEAGRPIVYKDQSMTWNGLDQLIQVGDNIQYAYDMNGIRKKKVVSGVTTEFITNGSQILSMKRGDTTFTFRYVLNKLVGFHYNNHVVSKEYLYQRNIQGDILGIYDDEGNQVGEYAYDGYGNQVIVKDEGGIANLNPFRYRGYFYDEETGFYDLNARYYDPETGRFISPDTLSILDETKGQMNGLNLYMYCANNPIMNVDPSGCVWWNPFTWNWDKIIKGIGQILMGISAIATSILTFPFGGWIAIVAGITFFAGAGMVLFGLSNTGEGISNYNLIKDGIFGGNEHAYSLTENIFAITAYIGSLICGIYGFTHTKINYERSTPRVSNPHSASYNYRYNVLTYYGKNSEMRYSIGFFERNHQWIHWHTEMPHSNSINNFFKFIWEIIKKGF